MDYCKIMADIEANPLEPVPNMTVRNYLGLKEHIPNYKKCKDIPDKVTASAPAKQFYQSGSN